MNVRRATAEYEEWLARQMPEPLVRPDVDFKHDQIGKDEPFPFFRGTYYLWAGRWTVAAGPLAAAPRVLAVGDLHVENFGTWRDADGRLCWGVNDFDEVDELPWPHDLVRLAASVRVAKHGGALSVKLGDACDAILSGYRECLRAGGRPFVLEEEHPELRAVATAADREPAAFWAKMTKLLDLPPAHPADEVRTALDAVLPATDLQIQYRPRPKAGMGSLGRPRYVAMAEWAGGWVCREAKATAPPATAWASGVNTACRTAEVAGRVVRAPDPFYRPGARWVVRRLAPRSCRIELGQLKAADVGRLLTAMGAEVGNVHLGTPTAAATVLADLDHRPEGWLTEAAKSFADLIEQDWAEWRSTGG